MNLKQSIITALIALVALVSFPAHSTSQANTPVWYSKDANNQPVIHLYFFWSGKCPHCLEAEPFMWALDEKYSWLRLHSLELIEHPENIETFIRMATILGADSKSVPTFMFCRNAMSGFDNRKTTGKQLENYLNACYQFALEKNPDNETEFILDPNDLNTIHLPVLGDIDMDQFSLPMLTLFIAGMDAFNPCAFFVLLFLLSMMVHAQSRKKMLLIGATFVFFSGAIYFLFMAAWLNLFIWMGELRIITLIAGVVTVLMALINIKDYFWFKKGISLSISDNAKPKLFDRMRNLLRVDSLATVLFATAVLAIVANSYELLCTAGFPMVYTRILTLNALPVEQYYFYLLFYNIVYVIPLFVIVVVFTAKLGSRKLSEREGTILKLLSGMMMLLLGSMLLFAPQLLNNAMAAAIILMTAIVLTWLIVKVTNQKA